MRWTKLKASGRPFYEQRLYPDCSFFVVMTGYYRFRALPEEQRRHTISLKDFLKFADRGASTTFKPHPATKVLNKDFHLSMICPLGLRRHQKALRVNGYEANDMIFRTP